MKIDTIKLKLQKFVDNLIDIMLPTNNDILNKFKNTTIKYWITLNLYKVDAILKSFADLNGEIDIDVLIELYEDTLFEDGKLYLDIKKMIPEDMYYLHGILPDKIIVLDKSDLLNIFK